MDINQFRTRSLTVAFLMTITLLASPARDSVSGEWEASFHVHDDLVSITLRLNRDGNKVTGTFESDHLGTGKLSTGSFAANRLSFTLDSPHGPIEATGLLNDGKIAGDFKAGESMEGKWEAKKKIE